MLLIVGLGNPGEKYAKHRHNIGFMAVDAIAETHGFGPARKKFQGELREGTIAGKEGQTKALVLKPTTYMNESGRAVGEALRFYKLQPEAVVVFHDELDIAPGKVKAKIGGGVAGHNGLKSIAAHIGPDFRRVRLGIGHPGDRNKVSGFVLGDFSKDDWTWVTPLVDDMARAAPALIKGDHEFTSALALLRQPHKPKLDEKKEKPSKAATSTEEKPSKETDDKKPETDNPFAALKKLMTRR